MNKLTTRVTDAEGKIDAHTTSIGSLNSSVGTLSSTVKTQGETLASNDKTLKAMYSIKVETNNGKKVGAGIVLGSDGSTSDMILYADRFSLFNRNSKTAVPVMIAEGNELYIDTARIKNGSIGSAKVGDIQSNNYVGGNQGWRITKSGASEFNNVVVRGEVHASSGKFTGQIEARSGTMDNVTINENCTVKGTVYADRIQGDVVRTYNLPVRGSVYIPPKPYKRLISIPTIMACASLQNGNGNQVVYIKRDGQQVAQTSATKLNPVGLNSWLGYLDANQGTTISYEVGVNYGTVMPNILVLVSKDG